MIVPLDTQKHEGLNEGLKTLLAVVKKYPGLQIQVLSDQLDGRPYKTIERQIKALIDMGLVHRVGSKKTGGYQHVGIRQKT